MIRWRRSTHSGGTNGNSCVEAAPSRTSRVLVRDSKHPERPYLHLSTPTWRSLLDGLKRL